MRRTSPSCLCAAGRETSCVVMTVQWSSPTCSRIPQSLRGSRECRSCCHTVAGLKSCLPPSAQRRCTCTLSLDECITPAQSAAGVSALSGQPWPLSSVPFLVMQRRASQGSLLTSSGEDRNTDWPMSLQDTFPLWRRAAGKKENWDNEQTQSDVYYMMRTRLLNSLWLQEKDALGCVKKNYCHF